MKLEEALTFLSTAFLVLHLVLNCVGLGHQSHLSAVKDRAKKRALKFGMRGV
jgi:hypothetical protein